MVTYTTYWEAHIDGLMYNAVVFSKSEHIFSNYEVEALQAEIKESLFLSNGILYDHVEDFNLEEIFLIDVNIREYSPQTGELSFIYAEEA